MESPAVSRADLIQTYIAGLNLAAVVVVSSGRRCQIRIGEPAAGEKIRHQFYFRPSHAELLLLTIGREGLAGKPAAALAALIERTAAMLGARYWTASELRAEAERQVAAIVAKVAASNTSGGLKHWNAAFKQYRRQQVAKAEKALPYSVFLERFVLTAMVRDVAMSGRAI
jgi:hypothetical protein